MFKPADLISKAYVHEQRLLHARPQGYGGKGNRWATTVRDLLVEFDAWSVLDYGCGSGALVKELYANGLGHGRLREYDPAIPGKDDLPSFADLVVCTDVLEHVEPERLDAVIAHLQMLARKAVFVVVTIRPSNKTLSDGRNAHLILASPEWWQARICRVTGWTVRPLSSRPAKKWWSAVLTP